MSEHIATNKTRSHKQRGREEGIWSSLASFEGVSFVAPEWYDFHYRDEVLPIGTESAGGGRVRYILNHPTAWDAENDRALRIRRNSKAEIESEARRIIDELVGNQVRLTRAVFESLTARAERLDQIEHQLSALGLSLESVLKSLLKSGTGDLPQPKACAVPQEKPVEDDQGKNRGVLAKEEVPASVGTTGSVPPTESTNTEVAAIATSSNGSLRTPKPEENKGAETSPETIPSEPNPKRRKRASSLVWPPKADFLEMLWTKRGTQIARELNRHSNTVLLKADELGLPRPESNHWLKQKYGEVMEIPEHIRVMIAELRREANSVRPSNGSFTN